MLFRSLISDQICMISFLLLTLDVFVVVLVVLLSLIALGVRLGCLFESFLVSSGRIVLL